MIEEVSYAVTPDRMIAHANYEIDDLSSMADLAVLRAKQTLPKITGHLSSTLTPVFGPGYFGMYFPDKRIWYLEQGTRPFTMNRLSGKVVPMWVDDPDGSVKKEAGRKAKTRVTIDGRRQTLIFRKASEKGQRKMALRRGKMISVPRSYPGAPGRISNRNGVGQISTPNGGVRWRHPGIDARHYLNNAMEQTAYEYGITVDALYLVDEATFATVTRG